MTEQEFLAAVERLGKKPLRHQGNGWLVVGLTPEQAQELPGPRQAYQQEKWSNPEIIRYEVAWFPPRLEVVR